jgi:8-oxo-dGTP pyrophosphatase MutT (NUDIX family)
MSGENNFSLSVFTYILNEDKNKLLMIKRNEAKRKKWGFDWGIIGGKVEPGELLVEAAVREAEEEIGITFNQEDLKFICYEERPSKVHTPAVHFFYTTTSSEGAAININEESDGYEWFSIDDLPNSMVDKEKAVKIIKEIIKK